jgi:hypothetical protein
MRDVLPLLLAVALAAQAGSSHHVDPVHGVSAEVPAGWHARVGLTGLGYPREVVALGTFPLRRGGS